MFVCASVRESMALCQSPSFAHEKGLTPQFRGTYRRFDNTDKSDCYDAIPKFAYFQYRWELAVFKGFTGTTVTTTIVRE